MPRTPYEQAKKGRATRQSDSDSKRKSFRKRSADAPTFDTCNPLLLAAVICLCTTYGASPTFSYTRDATSLVVAVYHAGERYVDYLSGPEELAEYFDWLVRDLLEVRDDDLAPYALLATKPS